MIFDKVKDIIIEQLDTEEASVTMEANIVEDLEIGRASCRERV